MTLIAITLADGDVLYTQSIRIGGQGDVITDENVLCPSNIRNIEVEDVNIRIFRLAK